jgi:hypothetical protein
VPDALLNHPGVLVINEQLEWFGYCEGLLCEFFIS